MTAPDFAMTPAPNERERRSTSPTPDDELGVLGGHEQLRTLLRITQAAATLDLDQLLEQVGRCLQVDHWHWDYFTLYIQEPSLKQLRQHFLYATPGLLPNQQKFNGTLVPVEGSQSGIAILKGKPVVANTREEYVAMISATFASYMDQYIASKHSSCALPLVCRGRTIGSLVIASVRDHAFDPAGVAFLQKVAHILGPAVENALAYGEIERLRDRLTKEKTYLESEIQAGLGELVGTSEALGNVLSLVRSVASTDSSVLISGETGTGKELVARAVHKLSCRRDATFVKLNCAAIPTGLIESELFGHERGAFTGAVAQKVGRFELADGGTLFLDEVGEIPLEVQPKLLRVLQEHELERLGSTRTLKVNVRIVAATNRDLRDMVAKGTFRRDLFYRLNVFPIPIPPLRERREDIPALAAQFVDRCARRLQKPTRTLSKRTLDLLTSYDWPGNVRELENVIERSVILSTGAEITVPPGALDRRAEDLPAEDLGTGLSSPSSPRTLAAAERTFILAALEETNWVVGGPSGAAARLGLSRTTLQARMRKHGISRRATRRL